MIFNWCAPRRYVRLLSVTTVSLDVAVTLISHIYDNLNLGWNVFRHRERENLQTRNTGNEGKRLPQGNFILGWIMLT